VAYDFDINKNRQFLRFLKFVKKFKFGITFTQHCSVPSYRRTVLFAARM